MGAYTCPICLDDLGKNCIALKCNHFMCRECYDKYADFYVRAGRDVLCPSCRSVHMACVAPTRVEQVGIIIDTDIVIVLSEPQARNVFQSIQRHNDDARICLTLCIFAMFVVFWVVSEFMENKKLNTFGRKHHIYRTATSWY